MNSEELELSLRSEFESYLNSVRDEMRQHAVELQNQFEAAIDNHRTQLQEAFRAFSERFDSEHSFDEAFKSSVIEHLRLARDEGSKVAATAMAEAEELQQQQQAIAPADYSSLRDAIADISKQDSQSAILKSLITHAAELAPRGAFFIIKSEHFVGWKVFGDESGDAESSIRDIRFATSADTILGAAVRSMSTREAASGAHTEDGAFLEPLHYGQPDRMYAIPLVARGRGVAVMYVDYGSSGVSVNVEALETLVRIAGLTVELLAATHTAAVENRQTGAADFEQTHDEQHEADSDEYQSATEAETSYSAEPEPAPAYEEQAAEYSYQQPVPETEPEPEVSQEPAPEYSFDAEGSDGAATEEFAAPYIEDEHAANLDGEPAREYAPSEMEEEDAPASDFAFGGEPASEHETGYDEPFGGFSEPATHDFEQTHSFDTTETRGPAFNQPFQPGPAAAELSANDNAGSMVFDSGVSVEPSTGGSPFEPAAVQFEPAVAAPAVGTKPEASIEVSASNTGYARLSDRPVDLPIQVPEDERRLHNDARRFARLLVSEIKLYNEKKVQEGRQSGDLYERLREAIDRSREMYDKRVQPPVAAKFDYFHYELVNALADGEAARLGAGYPGSKV